MALPAVLLAASGIASLAQTISGISRKSKAKRALENYQRQTLKNVTDGLRVSTLGAELQTQELQRRVATSIDALRSGGTRAVVGGLPVVESQQQRAQQQVAADLDRQQQRIDMMRAQDEARIRQIQEQRESMEIAGLGSEMAMGSQMTQAGLSGLSSTALAALSLEGDGTPKQQETTPQPYLTNYGSFGQQFVPTVNQTDLSQGGFGRFIQQQ